MENLVLILPEWPRCEILEELMVYISYCSISINNGLFVVKCCSFFVYLFFKIRIQFVHHT